MYDELVNRLHKRIALTTAGSPLQDDLKEAAEAIEELTVYVRQIEELRKDGYYLQKTKMMTYGQATMTMPLPQPPKEEAT